VAVALDQVIDTFTTDSATVVALSGDLGAGKTTLTQFVAENSSVISDEPVVVPNEVVDISNFFNPSQQDLSTP
jgi:tRNA A37 threonylcarbamoyladenosine biosynthesis protein TsaE